MKKWPVVFAFVLALSFGGMLLLVALSPDFVEPVSLLSQEGVPEDSPIWEKKLDDLADYLISEGVLSTGDYGLLSAGVATDARLYEDVELYWWDVKNLEEGTAEYKAYEEAVSEGVIDLWSSGNLMNVTVHGPFAIGYHANYQGDFDRLLELFYAYCAEE